MSIPIQSIASVKSAREGRIATVSVIEITGPAKIAVHTFPDDSLGSGRAEELFRELAKMQEGDAPGEPRFIDEEIEGAINDGFLDDGTGWELYLVHSETGS